MTAAPHMIEAPFTSAQLGLSPAVADFLTPWLGHTDAAGATYARVVGDVIVRALIGQPSADCDIDVWFHPFMFDRVVKSVSSSVKDCVIGKRTEGYGGVRQPCRVFGRRLDLYSRETDGVAEFDIDVCRVTWNGSHIRLATTTWVALMTRRASVVGKLWDSTPSRIEKYKALGFTFGDP